MTESSPSQKLLLVDEAGQVIDVFQIDRYDLAHSGGQEILAHDILAAAGRRPSDWTVRPDIAAQIINALESARQRLEERAYMRMDGHLLHPTIRQIQAALHYLRRLTTFVALQPDEQRQSLIDEMTLTAYLTEEIGQLVDLAWAAAELAADMGLTDKPFTELRAWLASEEPEVKRTYARLSVEVSS